MKTTRHALSALNVRTNNVRSSQRNTVMKNVFIKVATVFVAGFSATTLAACGVNTADEPLAAVTLNVTAAAPDCAADTAVKPDFCSAGVKIKMVGYNETTESPNPAQISNELTLEFDDSGEALGSVALPTTGCFTLKVTGLSAGYAVKDGTGGFALNKVMCMSRAVNELDLVIDNTDAVNNGSGLSNVKLVAVDGNGTSVKNCGWNFNSDQLDTKCTVDADGATCNGIAMGFYTVDVTCQDGALVNLGYGFEGIEDVTTDYTVIVTAPGSTGTGTTDFCVRTVDGNGDHVDETTCVISVNGNPVTPSDDPDQLCEGALLNDQPMTATISVVCGEAEGSLVASGPEDAQSDVTVTVTKPAPIDGSLCAEVTDEAGDPVANCTEFDYQQLVTDPTVSANPPASCTGAGKYYFPHVPAGSFDIKVTCGTLTGAGEALIVIGEEQDVGITVFPPQDTSAICVAKLGLTVDLDNASVDMGQWIGYGTADACGLMTPTQLAAMTVVDVVQFAGPGTCTSAADPNCPISITGLTVSMKNGFVGYGADEIRRFHVTVEDAAQVQGDVVIITKNGHTAP